MRALRLFVAVELPERWCRSLADVSTRLGRRLPPARWVKPENMHLTLAFYAAVEEARLERVKDSLADACNGFAPIPLVLAGAGTFPPAGRARVAWVGVKAGPELAELAERIRDRTAAAVGVPRETRTFRPHLTVARCRPAWAREAAERFAASVAGELGDPWIARDIGLIESHLGKEGTRYRCVASYPLESSS